MNKEEMYLNIVNSISDGVYFVDTDRTITFWNKAAEKITGYSAEEIVFKQCADSKLNHIDEDGRPLCIVGCPLYATIIDGKGRKERVFVRHKDGYRIPIRVNIQPVYFDGKIIGAVELFAPDSPKVYDDKLVESLHNQAMHDALTGLPNRTYLDSYLGYKMSEYDRFHSKFAVFFADIDNFRDFNNTYGHDVGDMVLKNVAMSIQKSTRKTDFVGRWGGEEFIGIISISKDYEATILADQFRTLVESTQVTTDKGLLNVTISVGVTIVKNGDDVETLIKRVDKAMYKSKEAGKNRVTIV